MNTGPHLSGIYIVQQDIIKLWTCAVSAKEGGSAFPSLGKSDHLVYLKSSYKPCVLREPSATGLLESGPQRPVNLSRLRVLLEPDHCNTSVDIYS